MAAHEREIQLLKKAGNIEPLSLAEPHKSVALPRLTASGRVEKVHCPCQNKHAVYSARHLFTH